MSHIRSKNILDDFSFDELKDHHLDGSEDAIQRPFADPVDRVKKVGDKMK